MPRAAWLSLAPRMLCTAIVCALVSAPARSETLLALAGIIDPTNDPSDTYGWQLEFQEPLSRQLTASLSWLNEGHSPRPSSRRVGDPAVARRTGYGAIAWNSISARVPYLYFDTQQESSSRGYSDVHSVGALVSASLSLNLTPFVVHESASE